MSVVDPWMRVRGHFFWWLGKNSSSKRRREPQRLTTHVQAAEARVLLSGVTAVDDSAFTSTASQTVIVDVAANDVAATSVASVGDAASGSTELLADGRISYTANEGFTGIDSFSYTVNGSDGSTDTASVSVTVAAATTAAIGTDDQGRPEVNLSSGFTPDPWTGFDSPVIAGNYSYTNAITHAGVDENGDPVACRPTQ